MPAIGEVSTSRSSASSAIATVASAASIAADRPGCPRPTERCRRRTTGAPVGGIGGGHRGRGGARRAVVSAAARCLDRGAPSTSAAPVGAGTAGRARADGPLGVVGAVGPSTGGRPNGTRTPVAVHHALERRDSRVESAARAIKRSRLSVVDAPLRRRATAAKASVHAVICSAVGPASGSVPGSGVGSGVGVRRRIRRRICRRPGLGANGRNTRAGIRGLAGGLVRQPVRAHDDGTDRSGRVQRRAPSGQCGACRLVLGQHRVLSGPDGHNRGRQRLRVDTRDVRVDGG